MDAVLDVFKWLDTLKGGLGGTTNTTIDPEHETIK